MNHAIEHNRPGGTWDKGELKMKYEIENENYEVVKVVEADDIREVLDTQEIGEDFSIFFEGQQTEYAYNGIFKVRRQ